MPDSAKAVGLIVTVFVAGLLAAFLMPTVIGAMGGPADATYNQTVGDATEIEPGMNLTLDSVDTTADTASYTVTAGGDSESATVDNGTNTTVTVDDADVTLEPEEITTNYAVTSVETPQTYGWGGSATALWGILPVILVLAVFLYFVYRAVSVM